MNHPETPVTILLNEAPHRAMEAHALRCRDREVAGMMVGPRPEKQPDGYYVVEIQDYIEARFTISTGGIVKITAESWRYVHAELARRHPGHLACIVGWMHTHPNMRLFLSESDRFIHCGFFKEIWQLAAVLDGVNRRGRFFAWNATRDEVHRHEFVWHWG